MAWFHSFPSLQRWRTSFVAPLGFWLVCFGNAPLAAFAQPSSLPSIEKLELNQPVEKPLAGGQTHIYQLTLPAGQFVKVQVEQHGIGVGVRWFTPNGARLLGVDSERGLSGTEELTEVTDEAGTYQLHIFSSQKLALPGRYLVTVMDAHPATEQEQALAEAARLQYASGQLRGQGKLDLALEKAQRSLEIREKYLGKEHYVLASSYHAKASALMAKGDFSGAEEPLNRALELRRKAKGEEHPLVADSFILLGNLFYRRGDLARAEPLFLQALVILEKRFGQEHEDIGTITNNLGNIYRQKEDWPKAITMYSQSIATTEKLLGPDDTNVATTVNNLANVYRDQGDYDRAEPMYQRARSIWAKELGPEHPNIALALNNLGSIAHKQGDYALAEQRYQQSVSLYEKNYGATHQALTNPLLNLVTLALDQHHGGKALPWMARTLEINEDYLRHNLSAGSEQQKLTWLATFKQLFNTALTLHLQFAPDDPTAIELAATALLRSKGRGLDAMNDALALLRQRASGEDLKLLEAYSALRTQLATFSLSGGNAATFVDQQRVLKEKLEQQEAQISARSEEFRTQAQKISLSAVQAAIPPDGLLLEYTIYTPYQPGTPASAPRYAVYVLSSQATPRWRDLGDATIIDHAVQELREALQNPRLNFKAKARALYERVLQPVRAELGLKRQLFVSPDGLLNLVPFQALIDEQGQFLLTHYNFTYLTSGRDLLRLQSKPTQNQEMVVVADPAFGPTENAPSARRDILKQSGAPTNPMVSHAPVTWAEIRFSRLDGTAQEAASLVTILPQARLLTQSQATEAALKQIARPRLLHLATHGAFLKAGGTDTGGLENPLLRSGLALAGANQRQSGKEDGILTALEAAGLNLWGTQLVVMSACNTGVGEVQDGEGVYGLRRALILAGSESQVTSLWSVPDQGTKELMVKYYRRLLRGAGRGVALRQVQLELLKTPKRQHPFYWAGFIHSGEWANLNGKRP